MSLFESHQGLGYDLPSQQEWSQAIASSSRSAQPRNSILGSNAPQQELDGVANADNAVDTVSTILKVEIRNLCCSISEDVLTEVFSTVAPPISARWYDRRYGQRHTSMFFTVGYVEFDNKETAICTKNSLHMQWVCYGLLNVSFLHPLPDDYTFLRCLSDEVHCMSLVVEAFNEERSEKVVLKRATSSEGQKYIERELNILNRCRECPHIVQLIETDLNDGWLVVEHMSGGIFRKGLRAAELYTP